jgi:signal transduction histidine kinase
LKADANLMGQVILNLLKNAGEATVGYVAEPRVAVGISETPGGRVRITIHDNGPGVPKTLAEDIFLPFFTTKKIGTGVGLSFARQVVLLHKGAIATISDGSDFGFEILI